MAIETQALHNPSRHSVAIPIPPPRPRKLPPPRHKSLKHPPRIILPRRSPNLPQRHRPIPAQRILVLKRIIQILELLQRARAPEVSGQIAHDIVRQGADVRVLLRAVPGHVEQEEDVVVGVAVQAEDVAAAREAVGCEQAGQGLEFDGGVFVEGGLLVDL